MKDTMIKDVDTLNAEIYFEGYMYVGGPRDIQEPDYFAPYFTTACAANRPEVDERGITYYSRVIKARSNGEVKAKDLKSAQEALKQFAPNNKHTDRWLRGLEKICKRCRDEKWPPESERPLYFLDTPDPLRRTIIKDEGMGMIAPGYGTDFTRFVMDLTIR